MLNHAMNKPKLTNSVYYPADNALACIDAIVTGVFVVRLRARGLTATVPRRAYMQSRWRQRRV